HSPPHSHTSPSHTCLPPPTPPNSHQPGASPPPSPPRHSVGALASKLPDDSLHSFLRTPRHGVPFIEPMNPFTPLPRHPLGVFSFEPIRGTSAPPKTRLSSYALPLSLASRTEHPHVPRHFTFCRANHSRDESDGALVGYC